MTESVGNVTRLVPHGEDAVDGRRLRSERSRAQIVAAMRAVIEGGDMDPNATSVARAAGVSARTVFRHFEELDSLYRELNAQIEAEILPMVMTQFEARDWQGRACEVGFGESVPRAPGCGLNARAEQR